MIKPQFKDLTDLALDTSVLPTFIIHDHKRRVRVVVVESVHKVSLQVLKVKEGVIFEGGNDVSIMVESFIVWMLFGCRTER